MHTAFELAKGMFASEVNGRPSDAYELLDWGPQDRLGVVIDRPFGALGCGLLILLAASAFYDVPGKRRRRMPIHPEIDLFHVGGPWGVFVSFDFFPDHKEVFVTGGARETLRAINGRGVTLLVVPDKATKAVKHGFKEPECAQDRIRKCFAYSPSGVATEADVTLSTDEMGILENFDGVLEIDDYVRNITNARSPIPLRLHSKSERENALAFQRLSGRVAVEFDRDGPERRAARARVDQARSAGRMIEEYRSIELSEALELLH